MELTTELYKVTKHYPHDELFGLVSQMRRATVSIASNIAEGYGRSTNTDLIHFLYNSLGSSNELETQLIISKNLGYINDIEFSALEKMNEEVNAKLRSLIDARSKF